MPRSLLDASSTDQPPATSNLPELSVSELSQAVKRVVEDGFGYVRVRGELGRVSRPASGHIYLDLKDARAVLSGVIWKGNTRSLGIQPEQGLEVVATGRLTTFPGQSRYQIVIDRLEPAGAGALMALLEERKKKLAAEGLFDPARKQLPPYLPRVIGVVTSPSGAVIRDILHRLADRFPVHVLVWPAKVQGEGAAEDIARGITGLNALAPSGPIPRPDLIIVARGGGSVEDLWCFNEEIVVRAAAASDIPLISAVGHETDTTLIDFASDQRAPTPTAAAEMAVPVRVDLLAEVNAKSARLRRGVTRVTSERRAGLKAASRGLPSPARLLAEPRQRLDLAAERLGRTLRDVVATRRQRFERAAAGLPSLRRLMDRPRETLTALQGRLVPAMARLVRSRRADQARLFARLRPERLARSVMRGREMLTRSETVLRRAAVQDVSRRRDRLDRAGRLLMTLSHRATLERGFALVLDSEGHLIARSDQVAPGQSMSIDFADGRVDAVASGGGATVSTSPPGKTTRRPAAKVTESRQTSLFDDPE
ncbi:MAG: exodeoxyribonuclease VII large subunit [Pseudomonadota bacterium]